MEIEGNINKLIYTIDIIPRVFYSDLTKERTSVAKMLVMSEDFLKKEYEKDFNRKREEIQILIGKYHKYQNDKNSPNALATYNEILILFEKIPDVFVKKKLDLYKQITSVFNGLNNLILSDNINYFMKIYEASKVIENARDYISYVKRTKRYNASIVSDFRSKLLRVPASLKIETEELLRDLDFFDKENSPHLGVINKVEEKSLTPDEKIEPPKIVIDNNLNQESVNPDFLKNFNIYYHKLKNEKDKEKAMKYYRQIVFCLKSLNIEDSTKVEIISKIEESFKKNGILEESKADMKNNKVKAVSEKNSQVLPIMEKNKVKTASEKSSQMLSVMKKDNAKATSKENSDEIVKKDLGLKDEDLHKTVNLKVINEAYNYYNKLKNEKDRDKAIEDSKKIAFYLNNAGIDEDIKNRIFLRVRELVNQNMKNGSYR